MSRVGVLFRTTAVRLSALYLVLFSLCAAFLVFYVTGMSERLLQQQTREAIAAEVAQIELVGSEYTPAAPEDAGEKDAPKKAKGVGERLRQAAKRMRGLLAREATKMQRPWASSHVT